MSNIERRHRSEEHVVFPDLAREDEFHRPDFFRERLGVSLLTGFATGENLALLFELFSVGRCRGHRQTARQKVIPGQSRSDAHNVTSTPEVLHIFFQ
jgi:hypothetical protein